MATAIRDNAKDEEGASAREDLAAGRWAWRREELPFDFFIRLNIPRPRGNGYFQRRGL